MSLRFVATMVGLALCGACEGASPTGPDTISPPAGGVFAGTVYPQGHTRWPFTLTAPGTVSLTLTSSDPSSIVLGLGLGTLSGRGCTLTTEVEAQAGGSSPQLTAAADTGEKCVEVFDVGGVPSSGVSFSVSIRGS